MYEYIRVVYFQLFFYFFLATKNSVRNEEKKILTRPPSSQKILIGRYHQLSFIWYNFSEIYFHENTNWHWVSKIIERNYEINFLTWKHLQRSFWIKCPQKALGPFWSRRRPIFNGHSINSLRCMYQTFWKFVWMKVTKKYIFLKKFFPSS